MIYKRLSLRIWMKKENCKGNPLFYTRQHNNHNTNKRIKSTGFHQIIYNLSFKQKHYMNFTQNAYWKRCIFRLTNIEKADTLKKEWNLKFYIFFINFYKFSVTVNNIESKRFKNLTVKNQQILQFYKKNRLSI